MKTEKYHFIIVIITSILLFTGCTGSVSDQKIVIAHRGASGYLPEHTLESAALAYGMGADYIEQDVVLTKDNRAVVLHDHFLDTVTNVAEVFPSRKRPDGRYYVIDFTLQELQQLTAHERIDLSTGKAVFPTRFPYNKKVTFKVPTLEEELEIITSLNRSTGKNTGVYVEIKAPHFYKKENIDIAKIVLSVLSKYGYSERESRCYIQCFDPATLKYIKSELKSDLKLVQLIADPSWNEIPGVDYNTMLTRDGIKEIAEYADGIGPWINQIAPGKKEPEITDLVKWAHEFKIVVHPYTARADSLPEFTATFNDLMELLFVKAGVDGIFSDFPDKSVRFLQQKGLQERY